MLRHRNVQVVWPGDAVWGPDCVNRVRLNVVQEEESRHFDGTIVGKLWAVKKNKQRQTESRSASVGCEEHDVREFQFRNLGLYESITPEVL